jgi:amino acid transporter
MEGEKEVSGDKHEELPSRISRAGWLKNLIIGRALDPHDSGLFPKLSLIAFFAWVGLGVDGLSSSCYGPEEAFLSLRGHTNLGLFVALATVLTIFVISASYSQIIELFPTGGGGYLVASKLLSPSLGMLSGCALLVDYVLTITLSVASGADALFSFLPLEWQGLKLHFAILGVGLLTLLNLRGVKESVLPLVPIFLLFILTHVFAIGYALITHSTEYPAIVQGMGEDIGNLSSQIGAWGVIFLVLHAYSMGAGTFTGIEAVSNGLPILREPRVQTAKRTMRYMAISLSFMALGLMLSYVLYQVGHVPGRTLNAILFDRIAGDWGESWRTTFVWVTLFSEAVILFVAAQTGFLGGPRVLANMALDRWVPTRFAMLSDRLVTQNGVLIMGGVALVMMVLTRGSVRFLVVLYSINVFITFTLSQTGMIRHWWNARRSNDPWRKGLLINGIGLLLSAFILIAVTIFKFNEGGWVTLFITGALIGFVIVIRRHYKATAQLLRRLDRLVQAASSSTPGFKLDAQPSIKARPEISPQAKTAILLVNGFNGLGLHTLFSLFRLYGEIFRNFIFVEIGVVDAGAFKGPGSIEQLEVQVKEDLERYIHFVRRQGFYAEGLSSIGVDVVEEVTQLAPKILERFPQAIFIGGQLVFPEDTFLTRWLHNFTLFALQRRLYHRGIPFVILPIRVY